MSKPSTYKKYNNRYKMDLTMHKSTQDRVELQRREIYKGYKHIFLPQRGKR